ncbi:hypothetical protein K438DRAFT_1932987 [Mycena galopus ATCC 62051]|nr:hypothetical protein K438DRAFT_1932987 [Mycena galopus ATCC 62051]
MFSKNIPTWQKATLSVHESPQIFSGLLGQLEAQKIDNHFTIKKNLHERQSFLNGLYLHYRYPLEILHNYKLHYDIDEGVACIYSHNVRLRSHVLPGGAEGFTTASQEPAGHHPDRRYAPDGKEVDEKGCSKSVVSHDIGSSFGQRRTPAGEDIIITFKSRDPGLEQVVEVLRYRISPLQGRV